MDVTLIHAKGGERRELEEWSPWIKQPIDPLARQELAALDMALARTLIATHGSGSDPHMQFIRQSRRGGCTYLEALIAR
jgi:hypothetical protein